MANYNSPEDSGLQRIITELQDRIERLERNSSGENITGGSVNYSGTELIISDTAGNIVFKVGLMPQGDYGLEFKRADSPYNAIQIQKLLSPTDAQTLILYDRAGRALLRESVFALSGLDAPAFYHGWRPADRSDAKTTVSATFETLFKGTGIHQNPALPMIFHCLCSDGTTSGEIQVIDTATGNPLAAFFQSPWVGSIPTGTTTELLVTAPNLLLPGTYMADSYAIEVQARRTAGAGTVSVGIAQTMGGQV